MCLIAFLFTQNLNPASNFLVHVVLMLFDLQNPGFTSVFHKAAFATYLIILYPIILIAFLKS